MLTIDLITRCFRPKNQVRPPSDSSPPSTVNLVRYDAQAEDIASFDEISIFTSGQTSNEQNKLRSLAHAIKNPKIWDNEVGDFIPQLAVQLPGWPSTRGLVVTILQSDGSIAYESRFAQGQPDLHHAALKILPEDVHIRLDNHHYEAVIRDHPRAIRRDGDCFYNAALTTLSAHSRQESRAFANNANVFREKIAQYILDHADKLDAFIDQKPNSSSALFSFPKANIAQSPLKSPHEIWYKIGDYFAPTSLTKLGKVNQYLTHITSDNALWPVHLTKAEQQNFKNQRTEFIAQSQSLKKSFGQHRTLRLASQQAYVDADKKQLIEDLSRQLEETLQECRPNLFKVYCRYPALADTLLASRKNCAPRWYR